MRILVFGATGNTGQSVVKQALARGHVVTAFVRNRGKLTFCDANLESVEGDIGDRASLQAAFDKPVDAVVSALGIYHLRACTDLSDGTRNIMDAMATNNVRRIVIVSSIGVGDSRGQGNLPARLIQKTSLRQVLADKERQEQLLRDSDLNWTAIRPPRLTDGEAVSTDVVMWQGETPTAPTLSWQTSRATVAGLVLDAIEQRKFGRSAWNISEPG